MRFDRLYTKLFCRPVLLESATRVGFELALLSLMEGGTFEQAAAQFHGPDEFRRRARAAFDEERADGEGYSFQGRKVAPDRAKMRADGLLEMRGNDTALIHIAGTIDKNLSSWDRMCLDATDLADVDRALPR